MIFITLGTQPCDFSRCLKMVEELISVYEIKEDIIAQVGHTKYTPNNIKCFDFVEELEYQKYISSANIIISHAGTGALFSAIRQDKKIIAVARLHSYGEMVDNHQVEIVKKLSDEGYIIDGTTSIIEAWDKIKEFEPREIRFQNNLPEIIENQIFKWLNE